MLHNKFIVMGMLCVSAFVQGAADTAAQLGESSLEQQTLQLEGCFSSEKLPAFGPARAYSTFAVSKRFKKESHPGFIHHKVSDDAECDLLMGCVGIVEGNNIEATSQIAALIKSFATQDTSWIPAQSEAGFKDVAKWNRTLRRMYLNAALKDASQSSYEQYARIRDVSLLLVWFQSSKGARMPFELSRKYTSRPLRDVIMPLSINNDCKFLVECHPSIAPIEQLAECAKSVSVSHEATVLRLNPTRLNAFLSQEFGK